jgi:hypothetical protein
MERKNPISSRMSNISTISTISTIHTSTINTTRLSTLNTTRISTLQTIRTNIFSTINIATLTNTQLQTMQQNAKNDHQKIGTTLNDFASVFNTYTTTTDPVEKAAWGVIAQKRLNEFQGSYNTNRIGDYISTVTKTV